MTDKTFLEQTDTHKWQAIHCLVDWEYLSYLSLAEHNRLTHLVALALKRAEQRGYLRGLEKAAEMATEVRADQGERRRERGADGGHLWSAYDGGFDAADSILEAIRQEIEKLKP